MQNVVTPDQAYRTWWIWWSVAALAAAMVGSFAVGCALILVSRVVLFAPVIRAIESLKR